MAVKLRQLDTGRPYGTIYGGVRQYTQDDLLFDAKGREIRAGVQPEPDPEDEKPVETASGRIDFKSMPLAQLKRVLAHYGADFKDFDSKADALAYLEGRRVTAVCEEN